MMQPLSQEWETLVNRKVPYYHCLPTDKQEDLRALIQVFLDEKPFEGCGGLEITDEIRLTIASYACILLLGGQSDMYPKLRTILVYPYAYLAPHYGQRPDGTVSEGLQPRVGESWSFGNIVLSWDDVQRAAANPLQGRNVVFHEFAHQLDAESGPAPGAPILPASARYEDWARVMGKEYRTLIISIKHGRPSLIDKYGATNPAEFFAVVTECFFLKPAELEAQHPELYQQLSLYYRQDPRQWVAISG